MKAFNPVSKRQWSPSPFHPEWERSGLRNDRLSPDVKRQPGEKHTTIVRRVGPGEVALPPFDFEWELFVVSGEVRISTPNPPAEWDEDGMVLHAGDHCIVEEGEGITVRTENGCEYLVIAR